MNQKKLPFIPAILLAVALIPGTALATPNTLPGVGPAGEDPFPPGTEWTYNSESGSLCSTTPDGETNCVNVGEGRPCPGEVEGEVEGEGSPNLTCN